MKRFILTYMGENIFKDKRSFKTEEYAKTKQASFREWETTFNKRCDVEIQEIEVETSEEKLQQEIKSLKAMIVEAAPFVDTATRVYCSETSNTPHLLKAALEWLAKTENIGVTK